MSTSQNGWTLIHDSSVLDRSKIPGTNRQIELRAGDVRVVLDYLLSEFHKRVEPLDEGQRDDWGWAKPVPIPGSSAYSNHGSGTGVDANATRHPWGARGTFTGPQRAEIEEILVELDGVVRWGGHYTGKADEMHFEINANAGEVARVAARLRGEGPPPPNRDWALLRLGSTGDSVRVLQARLNRDYPRYSALDVDGIFGNATRGVVLEFQRRAGLDVDGIAGPATLERLGL